MFISKNFRKWHLKANGFFYLISQPETFHFKSLSDYIPYSVNGWKRTSLDRRFEKVKRRILLTLQDISKKILIIISKMSLGRKNLYIHLYCQDLYCITLRSCQSLGWLNHYYYWNTSVTDVRKKYLNSVCLNSMLKSTLTLILSWMKQVYWVDFTTPP